ncbi:DUF711 family protein [Saccharopolyspora taberi]|uniref:PFL family protein n=1 Tax=Saccharopolyspora taberi TaxID=60895 RepID=A0ABN3VJD1_9PSEU
MGQPVIRTITLGLAGPHPLSGARLAASITRLRVMEAAFRQAGYEVQTVRITAPPVFDDFPGQPDELSSYARRLQTDLDRLGIDHFSLGPARATRRDILLEQIALIEKLIPDLPALSSAVQIATAQQGILFDAVEPTAHAMLRIAQRTEAGIGNFRFAALACVPSGHPFFPAGYHQGPDAVTIGLQGAGIVTAALANSDELDPASITARVREAMITDATPVVRLGQRLAEESGLRFGGIDLSPAPSVDTSIGAAIELGLVGRFGAPGTVAVVAAITEALRSTNLPTCGYNGLMLPVMEDTVLAREWTEGRLRMHQLLAYSTVCGTGLDTVPLPGDTSVSDIAGLLMDVATLAVRLAKPLSARLFPLPGKQSGDHTTFTSPYLINLRLP